MPRSGHSNAPQPHQIPHYTDCECVGGRIYSDCPSCLGQPRLREVCRRCEGTGTTWTPCPCTGYSHAAGTAVPDATWDSGHNSWHDRSHGHGHGQGRGSSGRSATRH